MLFSTLTTPISKEYIYYLYVELEDNNMIGDENSWIKKKVPENIWEKEARAIPLYFQAGSFSAGELKKRAPIAIL